MNEMKACFLIFFLSEQRTKQRDLFSTNGIHICIYIYITYIYIYNIYIYIYIG